MSGSHRLLLCASAWLLLGASLVLQAAEFDIEEARTYLEGGTYRLDADIDLALSEQALEALDNGVPLTIEVRLRIRRDGAWVWEESLQADQWRYRIRYKPLSERYSIDRVSGGEIDSFVSRESALRALGTMRGLRLVDADRLATDEDYAVHLRVALDIDELPLPLRPIAYLRPAWKLESKWTQWPLRR